MSSAPDASSHPSSSPDPDPAQRSPLAPEFLMRHIPLGSVAIQQEDIEDAPFWKEVAAFNQLPQPMIDQYYGQYVAVYQGNIVDSDLDEGELALRFYRTYGYVPVYIHQVGTEEGLVDPDEF